MNNTITVSLEKTFEINEGFYRAKLTDIIPTVRNKSNGAQQWRRFLWEVQVPGIRYKQAMAGRNFPFTLDPGSDLRNFLQTWLGKQYFELNGGKTIDLDSLIDMECELELVHFTGKGYSTPMTFVASAHRVGSLELTEEAVAAEDKDNN